MRGQNVVKEVAQLPAGCFQEGAGDCIWDAVRRHFWAGFGPRSSREAIGKMADFFGREIVPLQLFASSVAETILNAMGIPVLVGLGVDELSMSPACVLRAKKIVSEL